jgi:hypothetical protein
VKIVPPADVDFWVYSELIREDVIGVSKANVRVGPGINYSSVGFVVKGDKVEVRGSNGEWSKIAPPVGCFLYISGKYVERFVEGRVKEKPSIIPEAPPEKEQGPSASEESVEVKPPPAAVKERTVFAEPVVASRVPERRTPAGVIPEERLVSSRKQGEEVRYAGILRPSGFVWRRPSKFRLVKHDESGRASTVCYVIGQESRLTEVVGTAVVISGKEYWIQGVRAPVVVPEKISRKR